MRQIKITQSITKRDSQSLDKYLAEISREKLITAEDEVGLAQKIKAGDYQALESLVKANLRFVVSVAKQYQHQGLSLPDLINEGNLGLIKAAKRFDETRGFKFVTYAVWWIRQTIQQALTEHTRIVRLPLNKIGVINKVNKTFTKLQHKHMRDPTFEEIAEEIGRLPEDVKNAIDANKRYVSMDSPVNSDGEEFGDMYSVIENKDTPSPDSAAIKKDLLLEIERVLKTLSGREADVIRLYYGLGENCRSMTLEEISEKFGLTRERVRQIKSTAMRRLKHSQRTKLLREFLK